MREVLVMPQSINRRYVGNASGQQIAYNSRHTVRQFNIET